MLVDVTTFASAQEERTRHNVHLNPVGQSDEESASRIEWCLSLANNSNSLPHLTVLGLGCLCLFSGCFSALKLFSYLL